MTTFTLDKKNNCLLEDFNKFLEYLSSNGVTIGKTTKHVATKFLCEMNELMSIKQEDITPRSRQLEYPMLHMFCNLAVSGKLFVEQAAKGGKLVLKSTNRVQKFNNLNNTEKYIFLLEILWMDCNIKDLTLHTWDISSVSDTRELLIDISNNKANMAVSVNRRFKNCSTVLLYFSYMGIMTIKQDEEEKLRSGIKRRFLPKEIVMSEMGLQIIKILCRKRDIQEWNIPYRKERDGWKIAFDEEFYVPFKKIFKSGKLENTLPRSKSKFKDGIYTFKVSVSKNVWSKIRLSGDYTLYDLHNAIQDAFEFDDDHMYSFFMDGKAWSKNVFTCDGDEGPFVDEVEIGELELYEKQNFLYLFDYGDEWRFNVEVFNIGVTKDKLLNPEIIETNGEIPEQYPDFDEE